MGQLQKRGAWLFCCRILLACLVACVAWAQQASPVITVDHGPNAAQQLTKPYVVLVSLDGFRYDYPQKYGARHLMDLAARGASAPRGMLPPYPSITFPSHYTIITGLYPEHHGIVANAFYDPARKEMYSYRDSRTVADGTWYGGTPLWVLAEQQGMRAASCFWVGSEADIQGTRPSYYLKYDQTFPNARRVEQVLSWLRLPAERRPHFITLYFSDVDTAGHQFGPDSAQVAQAVQDLDAEIGRLDARIKQLNLPVDVIVLADHGMVKVEGPAVYLDEYGLIPAWFERIVGAALYPKSEADAQKAYEALKGKSSRFAVYRRAQVPPDLYFAASAREGDPVIVPTGPYYIAYARDPQRPDATPVGAHGYDARRMPEMNAIFFAAGPDIRPGGVLPPFESVDVYPLVAQLLGLETGNLKTGPIDGKPSTLRGILKKQP
jgi:alkaline phosphatase D